MARSKARKSLFYILSHCAAALATPAPFLSPSAYQSNGIQLRDSTCSAPNFVQCTNNPSFPSDFCCPSSTTCISLDSSSSVLCCPKGEDCSLILPITCDVQRQNAAKVPDSLVKTTKLDEELPKCGENKCCPFGYTCDDGKQCIRDKSEATTTSTSASATSGTTSLPSTTATTIPTTTSTSSALSETTNPAAVQSQCPRFPGGAVAAGFFPGLISGSLLAALFLLYRQRRQRRLATAPMSFSNFRKRSIDGRMVSISDPIPINTQDNARSDFLLHQNSTKTKAPCGHYVNGEDGSSKGLGPVARLYRKSARVRSLFGPKLRPPTSSRSPSPPPPLPITPPRQIHTHAPDRRPPSTESIKVYSPPHLNRSVGQGQGQGGLAPPSAPGNARPDTTFTEMMERVGFKSGPHGSPHFSMTGTPRQHLRWTRDQDGWRRRQESPLKQG